MQIDRTQRGWAIGSLGIFAAAVALYLFETWISPFGARGGSAIGLFFGVLGFGFMIFAVAVGGRKRVTTGRGGGGERGMEGEFGVGLRLVATVFFYWRGLFCCGVAAGLELGSLRGR